MSQDGFIGLKKIRSYLNKISICLMVCVVFFGFSTKVYAFLLEDKMSTAKSLAHYTIGYTYDLLGLPNRSVLEYEKAALFDSGSYLIHLRLGTAYARLDMLKESEYELKLVSKYNPEDLQSRYLLALIYSTLKDYDKAAFEYEYILKSFSKAEPQNIEIYDYLGRLYYSQKKFLNAVAQYEKILELEPNNADVMYLLGTLYWEVDQKQKAIEILKKSIEIDPTHDGSLNSLGYFYAEMGQNLDESVALIKRALEVDPENGGYLDSLGWTYFKKGQYQESIELLEKASVLLSDPIIWDHLGDVYHKMNNNEKAVNNWQKSLELQEGQENIIKKINETKNIQASNRGEN